MKTKSKARTTAEFLVEVLSDDIEVLSVADMTETANELVSMSTNPKWKDRKLIIDTLVYLLRVSAHVHRCPSYKPLPLPVPFGSRVPARSSTSKRPTRK